MDHAFSVGAASVMLVHNHPSGRPEPSRTDEATTERLAGMLGQVGVRLTAHYVVGDGIAKNFYTPK